MQRTPSGPAGGALALQRMIGNAATGEVIGSGGPEAPLAAVQRRAETDAAIGFEFQELDSEVKVRESGGAAQETEDIGFEFGNDSSEEEGKDEESSDEEVYDLSSKLEQFGRGRHWWVVEDGDDNLEFVTDPIDDAAVLAQVMTEISYAGRFINQATLREREGGEDGPVVFELADGFKIAVTEPDDKGQPQVNPDVPLGATTALAQQAEDPAHFDEFYGADNVYNWTADATRTETAVVADAARRIEALGPARLISVFRMPAAPTDAQVSNVRGLLQVLAAAAVHRTQFPGGLEKDLPVLLKTPMGQIWKRLEADKTIGQDTPVDVAEVVDLLMNDVVANADAEQQSRYRTIVATVKNGKDPIWGKGPSPVEQDDDRLQILVELRRAPVIKIEQWPTFATNAYAHFIQDSADRYH